MNWVRFFIGSIVLALALATTSLNGQTPGLISGNLNVTVLPSALPGGKFQVSGTFSDPTGRYFASNVTAGMVFFKGNDFFLIDSVLSVSGSNLTVRVADTYSAGFIPTGVAQIVQVSSNLGIPGIAPTGDSNPSLATPPDHASLINYIIRQIDANAGQGSGGQVFTEYQAIGVNGAVDNGCFVTADQDSISFTRTGGAGQNTEGTVSVPSGASLRSITAHFSSGQAPGNTYFLNVDYADTSRTVNASAATLRPALATVTTKPVLISDADPALNFVHSGTPIQIGIAGIDKNTTRIRVRYKITNYSQQAGSNASVLTFILP